MLKYSTQFLWKVKYTIFINLLYIARCNNHNNNITDHWQRNNIFIGDDADDEDIEKLCITIFRDDVYKCSHSTGFPRVKNSTKQGGGRSWYWKIFPSLFRLCHWILSVIYGFIFKRLLIEMSNTQLLLCCFVSI